MLSDGFKHVYLILFNLEVIWIDLQAILCHFEGSVYLINANDPRKSFHRFKWSDPIPKIFFSLVMPKKKSFVLPVKAKTEVCVK